MSSGEVAFRFCWQEDDAELDRGAAAFWEELGVPLGDDVEARSAELCAIAYSGGRLIAVSTARIQDYPRFGCRFAFYRTAVALAFRKQNVAVRLCAFSRDGLAEWARSNPEVKLKGLLISLRSAELFRSRRHLPIIVTEGLEFVFVGFGDGGHQVRVVWFPEVSVE